MRRYIIVDGDRVDLAVDLRLHAPIRIVDGGAQCDSCGLDIAATGVAWQGFTGAWRVRCDPDRGGCNTLYPVVTR
jgi:hypothetical protein